MFAHNRINLLLWSQIEEMGSLTNLIRDNTRLDQFSVIYSEFSLFHFFAHNVEVIEMIHFVYKQNLEDELLTESQRQMPLVILHPDGQGRTAIDYAYSVERPRSADLMLDMLETYNDKSLSKLLTESIPPMIAESSDMVLKFLASALYQPVLMQEPLIVNWPEDLTEHIFTTHTSLIT
jgi:hypothetical protein